jgi:hypothetical protein
MKCVVRPSAFRVGMVSFIALSVYLVVFGRSLISDFCNNRRASIPGPSQRIDTSVYSRPRKSRATWLICSSRTSCECQSSDCLKFKEEMLHRDTAMNEIIEHFLSFYSFSMK